MSPLRNAYRVRSYGAMYKLEFTAQAQRDATKAARAGYKDMVNDILDVLERDPFEPSQQYEALKYNLKGKHSRRINYSNRIVYSVRPNADGLRDENGKPFDGIVHVTNMWGHPY